MHRNFFFNFIITQTKNIIAYLFSFTLITFNINRAQKFFHFIHSSYVRITKQKVQGFIRRVYQYSNNPLNSFPHSDKIFKEHSTPSTFTAKYFFLLIWKKCRTVTKITLL